VTKVSAGVKFSLKLSNFEDVPNFQTFSCRHFSNFETFKRYKFETRNMKFETSSKFEALKV
jgi:hypothetical protein